MLTIWAFDHIINRHSLYSREDENFCESLRENARNITSFEKKNVTVNKKELKLHQYVMECYICRKQLK